MKRGGRAGERGGGVAEEEAATIVGGQADGE